MAKPPKDKEMEETRRIMERLVKMPPDPKHGDKKSKEQKPKKGGESK